MMGKRHNLTQGCKALSLALGLVLLAAVPVAAQEGVQWRTDINEARQEAYRAEKLILLHFWDTWCGPCKKMDESTFTDPRVAQTMHANFVPVKVQVGANKELAQRVGVKSIPCDLIVTVEGKVVARTQGYQSAEKYIGELTNIANAGKKPQQDVYVANNGTTVPASGPPPTAAPAAQQQQAVAQQPSAPQQTSPQVAAGGAVQPQIPGYNGNQQPSQPQVAAATPKPAQDPGLPPLGLEGFCPVTLNSDAPAWIEGDPRWGIIHRGKLYLFGSEEAKQKFWAAPDNYAPVLDGDDVVQYLKNGQRTTGQRQYGVFFQDRVYLFASPQTRDAFEENPDRFAATLQQAMTQRERR